jgi:hypothetical protein
VNKWRRENLLPVFPAGDIIALTILWFSILWGSSLRFSVQADSILFGEQFFLDLLTNIIGEFHLDGAIAAFVIDRRGEVAFTAVDGSSNLGHR